MTKQARRTFEKPYDCNCPWPSDCFVQCGGGGIVFGKKETYRTAFFEAFPKDPDTFIRGEGKTVEEAEQSAWDKFEKISSCKNHEFERRGYTNGLGFCKHCNMSKSKAFDPTTKCYVCGIPTCYGRLKDEKIACEEHHNSAPATECPHEYMTRAFTEEQLSKMTMKELWDHHFNDDDDEPVEITEESIREVLTHMKDTLKDLNN